LNQYIESIYFKMDSLRTLRDMASPGDYMVKLDLRHAYLVVPIHPHARPAFRFRAGGDWQFRTLCFGVRSAPRVFTRLLKPVFAKLRQLGMANSLGVANSRSLLCETMVGPLLGARPQ
jgi:hypothetical protein